MARPNKDGLDYFPLDCQFDGSMDLIEIDHGPLGFMVIIKLWQLIYSDKGYYYEWSENNQKLFSRRVNVDSVEVNAIINSAITYGIFDKIMFEKGVLTSTGIQKRFANMTLRRKTIEVFSDLLLIPIEKLGTHNDKLDTIIVEQVYTTEQIGVNVYNNSDKIRNNSDKSCNNRESKQKEKVNIESKNRKESNILADDSDEIFLAKKLYTEHLKIDPQFLHGKDLDKTFRNWGVDINKIIRIDGRTRDQIENVIIFAQGSDFWKSNVLSGKSLRVQFEKLIVQCPAGSKNKTNSGVSFTICKNKDCGKPIFGSLSFCTVCGTDLFPKDEF